MYTFEIHVTVGPKNLSSEQVEAFRAFCEVHRYKPIIVGVWYNSGFARLCQTSQYVVGTAERAQETLKATAAALREAGFLVIREKIEMLAVSMQQLCGLDQPIPLADDRWYETHVVIQLNEAYWTESSATFTPTAELAEVAQVNELCVGHLKQERGIFVPLSFNLRKQQECFITFRHYGCTRAEAHANVEDYVSKYIKPKWNVLKCINEAVLSDSNPNIDAEIVN